MRVLKPFLFTILIFMFWISHVHAATTKFSILNFRFTHDGGEYFTTLSSTPLYQLQWTAGTSTDFAWQPLRESITNRHIVDNILSQQLFGAIGITDWLNFGFNMPLIWFNNFRDPDVANSALKYKIFNIGDPRLQFKATILDHAYYPVGLAVVPFITIPIGNDEHFVGSDGVTGGGLVVVDTDIKDRLWLSLNSGVEAHKSILWRNIDQNNVSFLLSGGASVKLVDGLLVILETYTRTPSNHFFSSKANTPAEMIGGIKWDIGKSGFQVNVGGGIGLVSGVGSPTARGFAGLIYRSTNEHIVRLNTERAQYKIVELKKNNAKEVKAVIMLRERCPRIASDYKAGVDNEDCPKYYELREVADLISKCPDRPEDFDPKKYDEACQKVYTMTDKYNETDISKVYIMNTVELSENCPTDPADFNPKVHDEGCQKYYELKSVVPLIAECPAKGHDESCQKMYGFEDTHQKKSWTTIVKLSKEDSDNDTIPDFMDKCPEVYGLKKYDGCPAPEQVFVLAKELVTSGPVTFKFDSYEITDESAMVLGSVAEKLISDPSIKEVRIEGYADTTGSRIKSKIVSQRRTEVVKKYLELHGVDSSRLTTIWYGSTNKFPGGNPANRRVIFTVGE